MNPSVVPDAAVNITRQYDDHAMQPVDARSTIAWNEVLALLDSGGTFWLTTLDEHARPHTRPVLAVVVDAALVTASAATAVKTRALRAGGPVSMATTTDGLDVVWSGTSRRITKPIQLADVARAYRATHGWDVSTAGDALTAPYGAPTAGPPPYEVFRIDPRSVHAIGTGAAFTGRSTRWDIPPGV